MVIPILCSGCSETTFIANKFATTFKTACAPNNPAANDRLFNEFVNCYNELVHNNNLQTYSDISVESPLTVVSVV